MAEPITIKKKKLTIKSKASQAVAAEADSAKPATAEGATEETPSEPLEASGHGGALDYINKPAVAVVKQPSYMIFAILALLATLMFFGLVLIQWTEFSFLQSAFPRPIQTGF